MFDGVWRQLLNLNYSHAIFRGRLESTAITRRIAQVESGFNVQLWSIVKKVVILFCVFVTRNCVRTKKFIVHTTARSDSLGLPYRLETQPLLHPRKLDTSTIEMLIHRIFSSAKTE